MMTGSKRQAIALSLGVHLSLFVFAWFLTGGFRSPEIVEIDLTQFTQVGSVPHHRGTDRPAARPVKPAPAPKEWSTPPKGSETRPAPVEAPATEAGAEKFSGESTETANMVGSSDGFADVATVSRLPEIANWRELQANLRKYYPEYERVKRNEGNVTIELRISEEGKVVSSFVVRSAGPAFDEAAKKVAALLRYKPALVGRKPVAVKLRQTIQFKLDD